MREPCLLFIGLLLADMLELVMKDYASDVSEILDTDLLP